MVQNVVILKLFDLFDKVQDALGLFCHVPAVLNIKPSWDEGPQQKFHHDVQSFSGRMNGVSPKRLVSWTLPKVVLSGIETRAIVSSSQKAGLAAHAPPRHDLELRVGFEVVWTLLKRHRPLIHEDFV